MTAVLKMFNQNQIHNEIEHHLGWAGRTISGLTVDQLLRGHPAFTFALRGGEELQEENKRGYYVSFVRDDHTIAHVPFVITTTENGWYYDNTGVGGPYKEASIDDVLYLIMHCDKKSIPVPMEMLR